jgi:hypothetical protein
LVFGGIAAKNQYIFSLARRAAPHAAAKGDFAQALVDDRLDIEPNGKT